MNASNRQSPAPVFVLCAPRSFSSVFCAMLGQHPQLYGFPELNLFAADTVQELFDLQALEAEVVGQGALGWTSGVVRVLAELEGGDQGLASVEAARQFLWVRRAWPTDQLLGLILDRVAPRAGVDKSPRTAISTRSLRRLRHASPDARIIHLTREPWASLRSLVRSHMQFAPAAPANGDVPDGVVEFYARFWISVQQLILDFTAVLRSDRNYRVRGEDVLTAPAAALQTITGWLEVETGPAAISRMLHPERSVYARPGPPGIYGDNDPGFLASPALRPLRAEPATTEISGVALGPALRDQLNALGARLGYR